MMEDKLTSLPHEILLEILKHCDPANLQHVQLVCRSLYGIVAKDGQLCKAIYKRILDDVRSEDSDWDYRRELIDFVKVRRTLGKDPVWSMKEWRDREYRSELRSDETSPRSEESKGPGRFNEYEKTNPQIQFVSRCISTLLRTAHPRKSGNIALIADWFDGEISGKDSESNKETFLCQSNMFQRARKLPSGDHSITIEERQASAKLHVLYGIPVQNPRRTRGAYHDSYPVACSVVYDLRNYKPETFWGPYMADGKASVDWEKIEAITTILDYNIHLFAQHDRRFNPMWTIPFHGVTPNSYQSAPPPEELKECPTPEDVFNSAEIYDPYNITGTWMRVVCFLDFHDLFAYNFRSQPIPDDVPRHPLHSHEALRMIIMELHVTSSSPPTEDDHPSLPVISFSGTSRSLHQSWDANANSKIRGTVRLTKEGEVRWQTVSVYGQQERWKSEGIQIGGVGSARGVVGHWFDKDWDVHGPAGPTAFWKTQDHFSPRDHHHHHHHEQGEGEGGEGDDDDDDDEEDDDDDDYEDVDDLLENAEEQIFTFDNGVEIVFTHAEIVEETEEIMDGA